MYVYLLTAEKPARIVFAAILNFRESSQGRSEQRIAAAAAATALNGEALPIYNIGIRKKSMKARKYSFKTVAMAS